MMANAAQPGVEIKSFELGPYGTHSYVVRKVGSRNCWVIDPSFDPEPLVACLRKEELKPLAVVLTHAHCDHIAGIPDVLAAFPGTPVWIHEAEKDWLENPELNLSAFSDEPLSMGAPARLLQDNETLNLEGHPWRVMHTPGHSPGSITLYSEGARAAIVGDALFAGSVGRTDFPGCSFEELESSIRTRLYTLPGEVVIHPGHGPASTIDRERRTNPFVRPA